MYLCYACSGNIMKSDENSYMPGMRTDFKMVRACGAVYLQRQGRTADNPLSPYRRWYRIAGYMKLCQPQILSGGSRIMQSKYQHIFEPLTIKHMTLKNRIVMTPMGTNYGEQNGEMSFLHINYYEQRAKGGTGLLIVENASVDSPFSSI